MKKLILILSLVIPLIAFSQKHRFIYSYQFKPDSTKTDSIIVEETRLDVFENHAEFLSNLVAEKDSAMAAAIKNKQDRSTINLPDGVYKNRAFVSRDTSYIVEYIGIVPYKVMQQPHFDWKISSDTKNIQGFKCQKATLEFGNRRWEAWFSTEIPFHYGPYIFGGLPGLILELKDSNNHHSFTLIESYKINNTQTNFYDNPYLKPIEINTTAFNKKWNEYRANPIGATEQFMILNPNLLSGKSFDNDDNELDFNTLKREEAMYAKKLLKRYNNYINLKLYN